MAAKLRRRDDTVVKKQAVRRGNMSYGSKVWAKMEGFLGFQLKQHRAKRGMRKKDATDWLTLECILTTQ